MTDLQAYLDKALKDVQIKKEDNRSEILAYDIEKEIAELIAYYRAEAELTQGQLAEKSGVSQANISKIENGSYCPSIGVLKRLASAMGKRLRIEFEDEEII